MGCDGQQETRARLQVSVGDGNRPGSEFADSLFVPPNPASFPLTSFRLTLSQSHALQQLPLQPHSWCETLSRLRRETSGYPSCAWTHHSKGPCQTVGNPSGGIFKRPRWAPHPVLADSLIDV